MIIPDLSEIKALSLALAVEIPFGRVDVSHDVSKIIVNYHYCLIARVAYLDILHPPAYGVSHLKIAPILFSEMQL